MRLIYYVVTTHSRGWDRLWSESLEACRWRIECVKTRYPDAIGVIVRLRIHEK